VDTKPVSKIETAELAMSEKDLQVSPKSKQHSSKWKRPQGLSKIK
jgi:hypothetical protein